MIKLIPIPKNYEINENQQPFVLNSECSIEFNNELCVAIDTFINFCQTQFKVEIKKEKNATIEFIELNSLPQEGYILQITNSKITITYNDFAGALYAITTLTQLIANYKNSVPNMYISDYPTKSYRGFMLDCGRYFFPTKDIYKFIDLMVMHKLNILHWHLTEDQGWRIEIDSYPQLTLKGSKRTHTNFNRKPHSGFYTKEEIRQIVTYANARNITVIPEIDMPGHMQSAIASYPFLSCFDRQLPVATHWGVKHDILCAGKDSTYQFITKVLDEVMQLFPNGYIHLGGDEATKTRWEICPHCQEKIKELGLENEAQLQAYFLNTVAQYLTDKGFHSIMWNEYHFSQMCDINIVWELWNGEEFVYERAIEEAKNGRLLINAKSIPYYLDLPYGKNSLRSVYEYESMFDNTIKANILGVEACLWTELVPNIKNAYKKIFPRLTAYSERAWCDSSQANYADFELRLHDFYHYLSAMGIKNPYSIKHANPKKIRSFFQNLWFSRSQLYWHGLHNLIDNAKVKKQYGEKGI